MPYKENELRKPSVDEVKAEGLAREKQPFIEKRKWSRKPTNGLGNVDLLWSWCLSEPWKIASPGHGLLPAASTGFLSATPHSSRCKPDHVSSLFKASVMVPYCSSDRPTSCLASHLFPLRLPQHYLSLLLLASALAASSAWKNPAPTCHFLPR